MGTYLQVMFLFSYKLEKMYSYYVSFEMMWDKDGGLLATMDLSENCISSHISAVHCGNCCWSISVLGQEAKEPAFNEF